MWLQYVYISNDRQVQKSGQGETGNAVACVEALTCILLTVIMPTNTQEKTF